MRIAITGLGCVSALGDDALEFQRKLWRGNGGIGALPHALTGRVNFDRGACVKDFSLSKVPRRVQTVADRFAAFGLLAALEALDDSGLTAEDKRYADGLILTASCVGGQDSQEEGFQRLYLKGKQHTSPFTVPRVMANSAASLISITTGIRGPSLTVSTACSSSTHAIGLAAWMVHHGLAPWAIAGGSEAPFSYGHLKAWESLQVVSRDTCRPFDRERTGLILGEGGAMLVLERREDAIARGARVYAEVAGFGMRSDAHHITQPDPAGAAATICAALNDADIQAQDVGYVNAHGTGTLANDRVESEALQLALGNHGHVVPVSSSKSAHGHALGATGALEAITSVLALHHGSIPPTLNVREQDPQCPIHLVKDAAMLSSNLGFAMSNSLAFGGTNACLIFRNHES